MQDILKDFTPPAPRRPAWHAVHDAFFCGVGLLFVVWVMTTTFFVGNVLALVSLLVVRPLNQVWHETFLDEMARIGWGTIVDYVEHVGRLSPVFTGDLAALSAAAHPHHRGNKIVFSNHATAGDPLALFLVGHRLGRIGNMRFMVKKVLLWFPVLGLTAYFLDFLFLSRDWTKDQAAIRRVFRSMVEGTRQRLFWICMFPEGTRLTANKLREAQAFAAARKLPVPKHVLVPRLKGLQATLNDLRAHTDAVLDVTIAYSVRLADSAGPQAGAHRKSTNAASAETPAPAGAHDGAPVDDDAGAARGSCDASDGHSERGSLSAAAGGGHLANGVPIRPTLGDLFLHRSPLRSWPVHIHVRVLPMSDVPSDEVSVVRGSGSLPVVFWGGGKRGPFLFRRDSLFADHDSDAHCICVRTRTLATTRVRTAATTRKQPHTPHTMMQAGITEWTLKVFAEKDKLLQHFDSHGSFPGAPNELPRSTGIQMM